LFLLLDSLYFLTITSTTIGLGDIVPNFQEWTSLFAWLVYVLFTLSLAGSLISKLQNMPLPAFSFLSALGCGGGDDKSGTEDEDEDEDEDEGEEEDEDESEYKGGDETNGSNGYDMSSTDMHYDADSMDGATDSMGGGIPSQELEKWLGATTQRIHIQQQRAAL
jgi:hypothetical protein